jgi:hypothetical protein
MDTVRVPRWSPASASKINDFLKPFGSFRGPSARAIWNRFLKQLCYRYQAAPNRPRKPSVRKFPGPCPGSPGLGPGAPGPGARTGPAGPGPGAPRP